MEQLKWVRYEAASVLAGGLHGARGLGLPGMALQENPFLGFTFWH
ncbi:hypothetical protein DB31_1760 [Hyalangium minutum]|uniref:Uncharacterized protein n=1 Tax=Hyalangium minutum TaxID=394096 RepID=A0A085WAM9_9BACT|nr:hypothetical protein DB31_1760 [Hyalangium minutum]